MFQMSDKVYNILKWCVILFFPACGTLYATLGAIWGFPYIEQIVYTVSAICAFLGAILGISSAEYQAQKEELDAGLNEITEVVNAKKEN